MCHFITNNFGRNAYVQVQPIDQQYLGTNEMF